LNEHWRRQRPLRLPKESPSTTPSPLRTRHHANERKTLPIPTFVAAAFRGGQPLTLECGGSAPLLRIIPIDQPTSNHPHQTTVILSLSDKDRRRTLNFNLALSSSIEAHSPQATEALVAQPFLAVLFGSLLSSPSSDRRGARLRLGVEDHGNRLTFPNHQWKHLRAS